MNKYFYVVYLYFEFQGKRILILIKKLFELLFFPSLWIINTEKASLLLMCSVKKAQRNMKNLKSLSAVSAKTLKILKR